MKRWIMWGTASEFPGIIPVLTDNFYADYFNVKLSIDRDSQTVSICKHSDDHKEILLQLPPEVMIEALQEAIEFIKEDWRGSYGGYARPMRGPTSD